MRAYLFLKDFSKTRPAEAEAEAVKDKPRRSRAGTRPEKIRDGDGLGNKRGRDTCFVSKIETELLALKENWRERKGKGKKRKEKKKKG